ncbi:MAG: nuclear transport factor 2 family protein [Planctomycetes bacterium]|nr:nuclear transport factor 2 family protein [Planctomycetota bacterium]
MIAPLRCLFVLPFLACTQGPSGLTVAEFTRAEEAVRGVLAEQERAWNAGLIDEYMKGYLRSPELVFVSGDKVRRGWQETRDGYHAAYGEPGRMGKLSFSDLEVRVLAEDAAVVTGAWLLERPEDQPKGRFTLLFRRIGDEWRIVLDHTSSAD